jgi:hypothetical protein
VLRQAALLKAKQLHPSRGDPFPRRGQTQHLSPVRPAHTDAHCDLVLLDDEIVDIEMVVGEGAVHHGQEGLGHLDTLPAFRPRQMLVLDVGRAHQLVGAVQLPAVDDLGEKTADDSCVLL